VELSDDETGIKSGVMEQNVELRRRLDEERSGYRRKLRSYQDEQMRQTQLVQKLQAKVFSNLISLPHFYHLLVAEACFLCVHPFSMCTPL